MSDIDDLEATFNVPKAPMRKKARVQCEVITDPYGSPGGTQCSFAGRFKNEHGRRVCKMHFDRYRPIKYVERDKP